MRLTIRPGKVTCAGIVAILLVLPNSIWRGADAQVAPVSRPTIQAIKKATDAHGRPVKLRTATRRPAPTPP
jgi:hypothetical protein